MSSRLDALFEFVRKSIVAPLGRLVAGVWASIAFEQARRREPPALAAQRARRTSRRPFPAAPLRGQLRRSVRESWGRPCAQKI
jgi:hypothetical protein